MKRRLELRPAAEEDLVAAVDWYESERAGLGDRLLSAVTELLDEITANPALGAVWKRSPETRRRVVRRFPYVVLYRVTDEAVVIVAIAHAKRLPGYWERR